MMTTESSPEQTNAAEIDCWPTQLEDTVEISPKHSKLISSLKKAIENGEEALENEEFQLARFCFESAEQAAEQLEDRDWNNTEAKERLQTETLPTIRRILNQLDGDTTETTQQKTYCN